MIFTVLTGFLLLVVYAAPVPAESAADQMITLREQDGGATIDIPAETYLQVELSGTPTSGYWWYFLNFDQEFLELVREETRELSPQGIEGGRILGIWLLRTKGIGSTVLSMSYHRLWERDEKAKVFSVQLRIGR